MRVAAVAWALVALAAGTGQAGLLRDTGDPVTDEAADLRAWIVQLRIDAPGQRGHGAVLVHDDAGHQGDDASWYRVVPYFANQGLLGYVRSTDAGRFGVVWDYVVWYLNHTEADGRILDHWYTAGAVREDTCPPGANDTAAVDDRCDHEDATDSYAATFLTLLRAYHEEGGDTARFNDTGVRTGIERVGSLLLSLIDPADGLSWNLGAAAPVRTKYLLDNAEVYEGLRAMQHLEAVVYGDAAKAAAYAANATRVQGAIRTHLFLPAVGAYAIGKAENATAAQPPDPTLWYWSGPQQLWPVLTGAANASDSETAQALAYLDSWWGDGSAGARNWTHNTVDHAGQHWAGAGWAAARAGLDDHARTHAEHVLCRTAAGPGEAARAWPFHVGDAGFLLQSLDADLRLPPGTFACLPRAAGVWLANP